MNYRREIDGLRAVAVVPVMLFHAGFATFGGGFVGVDVFFVISGYLITSIIVSEKSAGTFSILKFYERRARRILPALFLVMLVCTPLAWRVMLPDDLENFGESLVATAFFANNVLLWITSGYWDLANEFKPLLHTWSLGVEEQYYVLYPLFLLALLRYGKIATLAGISLLLVASLALAQVKLASDPVGAFMLLPTRAWELMIGGLCAVAYATGGPGRFLDRLSPAVKSAVAALGLALIFLSVLTYGPTTPFPGYHALLPTVGTALVILFATAETAAGRLLGLKLLVGMGLISYSAYLWHQPIFAFTRLVSLEEPSGWHFLAGICLAIALAAASWKYVEMPFRSRGVIPNKLMAASLLSTGLAIASVGFAAYYYSGFVHRWDELNTGIAQAGRKLNSVYNTSVERFAGLPFPENSKRKVLITGNSHARDFVNAALENGYFSNSAISYSVAMPTCLRNRALPPGLKERVENADYIIFGSPSGDFDCWPYDYEALRKYGAKVIVIGPKNFGWNLNAVLLLDDARKYSYRAKVMPDYIQLNDELAARLSKNVYVDVLEMIMDKEGRVAVFTPTKKIISQDREHLTKEGAKYLGRIIFEHPLLRDLR